MICLCGHRLVEHDETGRCHPVRMIGASQGIGPIVFGSCECEWPVEPAPLQLVDEARLRQAVDAFGRDVLGAWSGGVKLWTTPTDNKEYRAAKTTGTQRHVAPADVLAHLRGEIVVAVAPIGNAIVIDHDLDANENTATKEKGRAHASLILDTFGIPHVHHDGRSGFHTWIRLHHDPSDDEKKALKALLEDSWDGPGGFQVFPLGGTALRLPFGLYLERPRFARPRMSIDGMLAWLTSPERANDEQLAALVAASLSKPEPVRAPTPPAAKPAEAVTAPPTTIHEKNQEPIRGWNLWPTCKQERALEGPLPGKRHDTLLMLANEAVECGERDEDRLTRWLAFRPRPNSNISDVENLADVRNAVQGALRFHQENDPRRYSSCPNIPTHSGWSETLKLRETFQDLCTPERCATCPIYQKWIQAQHLPAYDHILRSSMWRDGRGAGLGLGYQSLLIYQHLLQRSRGDPELVFPAALNWLTCHLAEHIRRATIPPALDRLAQENLIERMGQAADNTNLFRVPFRSEEWVTAKEAALGTSDIARRTRDAILRDWHKPPGRRAT